MEYFNVLKGCVVRVKFSSSIRCFSWSPTKKETYHINQHIYTFWRIFKHNGKPSLQIDSKLPEWLANSMLYLQANSYHVTLSRNATLQINVKLESEHFPLTVKKNNTEMKNPLSSFTTHDQQNQTKSQPKLLAMYKT